MTPIVEARRLGYTLDGQQILRPLDLVVSGGERVAITGPSGSGKTTLLGLLSGIVTPTEGTVLLDGRPLSGPATPALGVATVLQGYGLVSLLTAAENVEIALRAAGWGRADAQAAAHEALASVGLTAHAHQLADQLSGGQQQRTAVARAIALQPRLLIADEPTAELDPVARALVLSRILDVTRQGAALVLATHDPEVAAACTRQVDLR